MKQFSSQSPETGFSELLEDPHLRIGSTASGGAVDYRKLVAKLTLDQRMALGVIATGVLVERAFGFLMAVPLFAIACCMQGFQVMDVAKLLRDRWFH